MTTTERRRAAAARQRLHRRRWSEGKIVLRSVVVDHVEVAEGLIAVGLLDPRDYDDARKISEAFERAHIKILGPVD